LDGKQDGGAGHGDGVRHRLGGVDCHGLICQQPGHQIDQGQQQDELPQHCHNDGAAGGANGNEGHLTGDLDTKEEQRPAIDPQGGHRKGHQRRVRGENPGKRAGAQLDHHPQRHGIAQTHLQQQPEGLPHPLGIPCAVIIAGDGLGALGDALQGQHGKLHDAGEDGHGANGDVVAVFQQRGIEAHGDDALAGLHDEGGRPQCYAGQNQGRAETDVFLFQPQQGFGAGEEPQHPDTGQTLGENGGQRCAPDAHVQSVNKNGVQNDVGHRADEHRPHSDLGKALCGDKGVQAQGQLHEHGAHSVDLHIAGGVADGVLAGAEGQQQIPAPKQQHRRQYSRDR